MGYYDTTDMRKWLSDQGDPNDKHRCDICQTLLYSRFGYIIGHNYHGHYLHAGDLSVNNYVRENKVREVNVRE